MGRGGLRQGLPGGVGGVPGLRGRDPPGVPADIGTGGARLEREDPRPLCRALRGVRVRRARRPLFPDRHDEGRVTRAGPLAGIRVLDVATVIAGPGAARYLADFGAEVLKIERPGVGDSTRTMGLPDPRDGTSLYWKVVGRNKRCATLDLKSDEGRDTALALAGDAHVVVENFRPGVLERLGLGPDVLLA